MPSREQRVRLRAQRLARSPRWAELWQIPFFCIGLACSLASLWFYIAPSTSGQQLFAQYEAALDNLNHADADAIRTLLQNIKASSQAGELREADTSYLNGCILLAEALKRYPLPSSSQDAFDTYARARTLFEQLLKSAIPYQSSRLAYRYALAQTGSEPLSIKNLDAVEQSLDADFADREKGYQLLTQLRLKLPAPDYPGALRSVDLLLSMIELKQQWPHRLQKAEILFHLQRWAEITRTTSGILPEAPEFPAATQWQAYAAYQQKHWGEAARLWSLVAPRELGPRALLFYGQCQLQLKNTFEAKRLWERLWLEHLQSPEAIPAQLHLAELAVEQARWHDAVVSVLAVLNTQDPGKVSAMYLSQDELKEKVKNVADRLIQLGRWDDLQQLATASTRWPFAGLADAWLSQSWHALAEPVAGTTNTSAHSSKAYLLASEHAWKAAQQLPTKEKQSLLLQSGQDALKARAYQQAMKALGELLSINPEPDIKPLVLIGLAEALQEQKQYLLAAGRLRDALEIPGNHEAQTRLRLAQLLLLEDAHSQEAGRQLELAAALASRPQSTPEARTACHRWAAYLYNVVIEAKVAGSLQAIQACEKALKHASPHPEAAQTRYLLAELLLAESRPQTAIILAHADDLVLRKQAEQLWQACQYFQTAIEDFKQPETIIYSAQKKEYFIRLARFGLAECWYSLGQLKDFAPASVPSADVCWQRAAEVYHLLSSSNTNRIDAIHAYLRLSWCQQKRGLFAEMRETLNDARQQLSEMKDDELTMSSRFETRNRSQWEIILKQSLDADRGQP